MTDYQWLAVPTLVIMAIVGGALMGWALRERGSQEYRTLLTEVAWKGGRSWERYEATRDNPDPTDSAGA